MNTFKTQRRDVYKRQTEGSLIDLAYRIRENEHSEYGGLEVEMAGIRLA